jgi:hypothetical protein
MTPLSNEYQMFSSVDSGPKLVDDFNDQIRAGIIRADGGSPSLNPMAKILLSPDELRGLWEKAKVTQNSRNSLGDEILKLYEQNQTGSHVRMAKIKLDIKNAHLALIGGATEIGYASMFVGTQSSSDGLQSRIAPVAIKGEKMPSRQRPTDPEKFAAAIIRLSAQAKADDQLFPWNDEAFTLYDQWWNSKNSDNPNVERLDGIVKKLLIILVRTNDLSEITVPIAKVATEIGDYVLYCRDKYCSMDAAGFTQAFENKIAAAYLKHGSLSPHQCKRLVHPERYPGGFGHFIFAFNNLLKANELVEVGRNHKSKIYKIDRP